MSKLEEAREIQREAGRTDGVCVSRRDGRVGCVCPLGALALAYGQPKDNLDVLEKFAYGTYGGVANSTPEHQADLEILARAAKVLAVTPLTSHTGDYVAADYVWRYNDTRIHTTEQAVALFTKAIELRDQVTSSDS